MKARSFTTGLATLVAVSALVPTQSLRAAPAACAVLTQAQVSTALGVAVGAGVNHGVATACQWKQQGGADPLILTFALLPARGFDGGRTLAAMTAKLKAVTASGIGDDAYYLMMGRLTTLAVKRGDQAFKIYFQHAGRLSLAEIEAKERALAQSVLANL